jgi:hypothetical protein
LYTIIINTGDTDSKELKKPANANHNMGRVGNGQAHDTISQMDHFSHVLKEHIAISKFLLGPRNVKPLPLGNIIGKNGVR